MQHVHGGDIYEGAVRYDFSASLNPLGMPPEVAGAAREGVALSVHYPDVHCRALRRAIAVRDGADMEDVICGNGAAELIYAVTQAVHPKRALLLSPGFAEYEAALRAEGCHLTFWACTSADGYRVGDGYLEQITEDLDILFLCNPNNPTGARLSSSFLEKVIVRCHECGVTAVIDECFLGFMEDEEQCSVRPFLEKYPELFILRAFTKLYAMPGLRIGYGLCHSRELLRRMRDVMQPWNVSVPAQMAGEAAAGAEDFAARTKEYVSRERGWLIEALRELGICCIDSGVNYLFFHLEDDGALARKLRQKGILIRDCSNFRGLRPGDYRIAVRIREENICLVEAIRKVLTEGETGWPDQL